MNDVSPKQKDSILKTLAIIGFTGIVVLIAWLSIQLVNLIPGAFSSLASLAEGVNRYQSSEVSSGEDLTPLTVTSNKTLINVREPVELTWENAGRPGSYLFSYSCTEGVAIDLTDEAGERSINCDTNYNVGDVTTLTLSAQSEKERYANIDYTVSFLGTNDTTPRAAGSESLTVVNPDIRNLLAVETDTTTEEGAAATSEEPTVEPVIPTTPSNPTTPPFEQEYTYAIPTSDPNGRTDLAVRFLNVGTLVGNSFVAGAVEQDESGAIQFEVKNLGTKTSNDWTYTVALPTGGNYQSPDQDPLKPNERAVVTIGFPAGADAQHTFTVTIDTDGDRSSLNDRFAQPVTFVQ